MIIAHTAIAIIGIIALIIILKIDPVIALLIGTLYLGLSAGLGFNDTLAVIIEGFGSIMAEVGLLIGFGVLMGSLLYATGALQRLVELLLKALGARRLPYTMSAVLTTFFSSIYVDVQVVLASPLARSASSALGRKGLGMLAGSLTAGILVGYVFVVPGLGIVAISGLLDIPLGTMLLYGVPVGLATSLLTTFLYGRMVQAGFWNPEKDEEPSEAMLKEETAVWAEQAAALASEDTAAGRINNGVPMESNLSKRSQSIPLAIALSPIFIALIMIAAGAIAKAAGIESEFIQFIGNPVFALFFGLLIAYGLAKFSIGASRTEDALSEGFNTTGQILLVTGVGGSLGAMIGETALESVLQGLFSAGSNATVVVILLAWFVAAVLHLAIGSISVAAIVAAGILAPIMDSLTVPAPVIALAIGAGALFALHVNSNFFWMFKTMLGITTQGALKSLTFVTVLASAISLPMIIALGFIMG
ncbi:GntP family permease [Indiicoccus explosivorum]|uniref:GntP family permease n=1 Tax=Indiicoccus explosivorum TaxID=1917864 RepID=UPI000B43B50F|nr:gluconate transporter [Indiicoccus explosivorum]